MNAEDEHTARLLRRAVGDVSTQWSDEALPGRLLTGVRRRTRRRATSRALLSVVAVAAVAGGWAVLSTTGSDALIAGPSPASHEQGRSVSPQQAGAILPEQAARAGLDGTAQCQSQQVLSAGFVPPPASAPGPEVIAAYLTDTTGFERWQEEFSGLRRVPAESGSPSEITPYGPGMVALCWFEGDIPRDTSVSGGPLEPRYRLLAIQFTGTPGGMRQDTISEQPIPVLAPPKPDPALIPADVTQSDVVHPQPDGVPVVDVLVEPPPPPPVDCFIDGCPDDQVDVEVDVRVNDEPFVPTAGARVEAGKTASFEVRVRVEAGERLDDLQIGLRADGTVGGNDPMDIVLLEADEPVAGEKTFKARWDVPPGASVHGLSIRYSTVPSVSDQRGMGEMGMGSITAR